MLEDVNFFIDIKNIVASENPICKKCIQLPMCMGGCKYNRYINSLLCSKKSADNMTLEEKIKLHYYSDLYLHKENLIDDYF